MKIMWPFGKVWKSKNNRTNNEPLTEWKALELENQLEEIINRSNKIPVVIFKHSTRCSTSSMAKFRLKKGWKFNAGQSEIYYLDLLKYRSISNKVSDLFNVVHQSPQILVIVKGVCVHQASHNAVSVEEVVPYIDAA